MRMDNIDEAGGSKMCRCLSTGAIFKMFGLFDIGIFFMLVTLYFQGHKNFETLFLFFILFFLPNIILFVVVILNDSVQTRKIYSAVLIAKIVIQGLAMPVMIMTLDNVYLSNYICVDLLGLKGMDHVDLSKGLYYAKEDQPSVINKGMLVMAQMLATDEKYTADEDQIAHLCVSGVVISSIIVFVLF